MSSWQSFRLSDPGHTLAPDPVTSEYLRCYDFPQPPEVRYGFVRSPSPQEKDRVGLFGQAWIPPHARGTVLMIHGFSEHAGNYARLIRDLNQAQLAVAILDLRGHGLSEGPRGHAEAADTYAEDVAGFAGEVIPQLLPSRPLYLWGHSLGALVGLQLLQKNLLPFAPAAAVFTSPLLGFPVLRGAQKIAAALAPLMAKILPTLPVSHGISSDTLSHDREYLARRAQDPLISRVATPRWLLSVRAAVLEAQNSAATFRPKTPTLLMLAGEERVTNLSEARKFAHLAFEGLRHRVVEFPGCYHELEKEPAARDRVLAESIAWFKSHS